MRLTPEQVAEEKKYLSELKERVWIGEHGLTTAEQDLFDTIEALQAENEQLQEFANAKAEGRLVKRGKWIYEHEWKCSSCGWAQSHDFNTIPNDILKYCPNCGAKMFKEEAEKALQEGMKC